MSNYPDSIVPRATLPINYTIKHNDQKVADGYSFSSGTHFFDHLRNAHLNPKDFKFEGAGRYYGEQGAKEWLDWHAGQSKISDWKGTLQLLDSNGNIVDSFDIPETNMNKCIESIKRDITSGNWDDAECTFLKLGNDKDREAVLEGLRDTLAIGDFYTYTRNLILCLARNGK